MSNIHVGEFTVDATGKDCKVKLYFHIPVPTDYQGTGFNLVARLVEVLGTGTPEVPRLSTKPDAAEDTQIENRELYEVVEEMVINLIADPNLTQAIARAEARYSELATSKIIELYRKYQYWGYDWNVS